MDKSTLTKMMPDYYQTSAVVENLNSVNATELNKAMLRFESVANQFFVQSADLSLDRWERELGLEIANSEDTEKRVVKILGNTQQTVTQTSKNKLPNTATTQTVNGVTFTVNADGSITVNGTPSTDTSINIYRNDKTPVNLDGVQHFWSCCPVGGSLNTYYTRVSDITTTGVNDTGNGGSVTFGVKHAFIMIKAGYPANNLVFRPQLEPGGTKSSYEKFIPNSPSLDYPAPLISCEPTKITVAGKNLLPNEATTKTINGITFTVNPDKSVTVNGTATSQAVFEIKNFFIPKNNVAYVLSGCPSGGSSASYNLMLTFYKDSTWKDEKYDSGKGYAFISNIDVSNRYSVNILIRANVTVNDLTFYPQLETGFTSTSYTPYAAVEYPLLAGIELNSVGGVRDEFDVTTGKLIQRVGKAVYDGSVDEIWTYNVAWSTGNVAKFYITVLNKAHGRINLSSDTFQTATNRFSDVEQTFGEEKTPVIYLNINKTRLSELSSTGLRAFLQSNPVTVIYELATPITTQVMPPMNIKQDVNTFADAGLVEIEIKTIKGVTYDERRSRIKTRLRGQGTTTAKMIKNVCASFSGGEVEIIENYSDNSFRIKFVGTLGRPDNLDYLASTVEAIKPAHLAYSFEFIFNTHLDLSKFTHQQLSAWTHKQLREQKLT